MTDGRILDYLRSRGRAQPPIDFIESVVDAVAEAPQQRGSRFAPFIPAAAALGAAAVVVAIALVLQQQPQVGPTPSQSASVTPPASAGPLPSATPAAIRDVLLEPGDVVEMPALDDRGEWGVIRLERGDEVVPNDPQWSIYEEGSVIIEINVRYTAERSTNDPFGGLDWGLRVQDGVPDVVGPEILAATRNPDRAAATSLGNHLLTAEGSVTEGWIALEVPLVDESPAVFLTYQGGERPGGVSQAPLWEVVVRERHRNAPPTAGGDLLQPGDAAILPAIGPDGPFGTITLDRGHDVGGYRAVSVLDLDPEDPDPSTMYFPNDPNSFYIEILVRYDVDGSPMPDVFGRSDWRLEVPSQGGTQSVEPISVGVGAPRDLNDTSPEMLEVNPGYTLDGWLIFPIPRAASVETLNLVYAPPPAEVAISRVRVRAAGPAPDHVPKVVPPELATYEQQAGAPISVANNAAADALFEDPDTCSNPVAGYIVTYPDTWYTNTAIGDTPACSWFSPVTFDVVDPAVVPDEAGITATYVPEAGGLGGLGEAILSESFAIGGVPGSRSEQVGVGGGFIDLGSFAYTYALHPSGVASDGETLQPLLLVGTGWLPTDEVAEYELNRAVLDRIMASLRWTETAP